MIKKNLIGIELRSDGLSAIELSQSRNALQIRNSASINGNMAENALLPAIKSLFAEYDFSKRANIAVSPPEQLVFFTQIQTAIPHIDQIRSVLKSQIEDSVPIPFEHIIADISDMVLDADSQEEKEMPVAAISKSKLDNILNAFTSVKIKPDIITPAPSTLDAVTAPVVSNMGIKDYISLYVDTHRCCVAYYKHGTKALLRTLPGVQLSTPDAEVIANLKRDIDLGKRRVYGPEYVPAPAIIANVPEKLYDSGALQELNGEIKHVSVLDHIEDGEKLDDEFFLPSALALCAREKSRPNFLISLEKQKKAAKRPVGLIILSFCLLAALLAIALGRLYLTNRALEQLNNKMDHAISESFEKAIPTMPAGIDHAHELRLALQDLRQRYQGLSAAVGKQISPVSLVSIFNRNVPREFDVKLDRIQARANALTITGAAESFSRTYQLQGIMSDVELFSNVEINLSSRTGTDQVGFVMSIDIYRDNE